MTAEQVLKEIEQDIHYFKNLGFDHIASKFQRDFDALKSLVKQD